VSDQDTWYEANGRYLSAALAWLRARLERLSGGTPAEPPADEAVARTAREMIHLGERAGVPPALLVVSQLLRLSRFEREVLLLCAGMELDTRIAALCQRAQGDRNVPYPTFALALSLFDEPSWDVLSSERPLRYWRLVEVARSGAEPLTTSPLRADDRIVNYIKGMNQLDERLAPQLENLDAPHAEEALPASQLSAVVDAADYLKRAAMSGRLPILHLAGEDAASKRLVARHASQALGLRLYRVPADLIPSQAVELETFLRLWQRESILLPVAIYVDAHDIDVAAAGEAQAQALRRFLDRLEGVCFLDVAETRAGVREMITIDVGKPTPAEQRATWAELLGPGADHVASRMAGQFNLSLESIRQIGRLVMGNENDPLTLSERVWRECVRVARPRMDMLAQRLEPKATWDDIVLPPAEMELLRRMARQVEERQTVYEEWGFGRRMSRGLGIAALFAGDSGTGKTMAAEVMANELRLNLYRIDLSAVVSKYIGETEKNLRRVFDAAEEGGAILFFDEADALFGKRSEIRDSHDRYANIEVNYLLQRMEAFRGLAILATNLKGALDLAFVRRLRFIVDFPFPAAGQRKTIWEQVFPAGVPRELLDFERLAELNLTGGSIQNVALNSAFRAAAANSRVSMALILDEARAEFRKLDRPINAADFRWQTSKGAA
jgi:hypothetical protein